MRKETEIEQKLRQEAKEREIAWLEKLAENRIKGIIDHVKEENSHKDMKLREYLMWNIVPTVSDAMIDVVRVAPIDPIDYMAEYIFKRSNEERKKERHA